ncbi:MAG: DeoR family transcriptional regulator [Candidatus Staskawiczbacteria bacterium]|nr:DeoR family transcriptional regulator [Candidatus Staskawiczbacteria bacterium]
MEERFIKLANSVYAVLEFFPESDPLKNRAKDKALAIFQNPTVEDIDVLLGYLWIAKTQGWLNSVNYLIVTNEYKKIKLELTPIVRSVQPVQIVQKEVVPQLKLSTRQKQIVDFLNKNEQAQVMDLQAVLPSITKRTIRRDLDELLQMGRIVRMGEFNQVFYKIDRTNADR